MHVWHVHYSQITYWPNSLACSCWLLLFQCHTTQEVAVTDSEMFGKWNASWLMNAVGSTSDVGDQKQSHGCKHEDWDGSESICWANVAWETASTSWMMDISTRKLTSELERSYLPSLDLQSVKCMCTHNWIQLCVHSCDIVCIIGYCV